MKSSAIAVLLALSAFSAHATGERIDVITVNDVYDGDTFRADIDADVGLFADDIPIRLKGIDTPEIRGACFREKRLAKKARNFTQEQLENAKRVQLRNVERGKYFRIVADVYVDKQHLNQMLLDEQLAVEYTGGKKQSWCE